MQWPFVRDGLPQRLLRVDGDDTAAEGARAGAAPAFGRVRELALSIIDGAHGSALSSVAQSLPRGAFELSLLAPGTHIAPHCGPTNHRLRLHLALSVPSMPSAPRDTSAGEGNDAGDTARGAIGIRVGNETRSWRTGSVLLFDDSFEHEVWNRAGAPRLVLIVDVWHPDLSLTQRDEVRQALGWNNGG